MIAPPVKASVPPAVVFVCQTLCSAGYEAWIVGGAVRDLLLGKNPGDWDVASDARPESVVGLFKKTIATGIEHGTVTVVAGKGVDRESIEVTSFRGEGGYSDSRRPDAVQFGVPLDEDLKRRDFVINAMAFDPISEVIHDPLGGIADLSGAVIRAVGDARERFQEDGLRVMRAVRFVSTLDFALAPETEAGLGEALVSLANVAQERIRVELLKLLGGKAPARALLIAERHGLLSQIIPEWPGIGADPMAFRRVSCVASEPILRLAALLAHVERNAVDGFLRRLTMSNEDRQRIMSMLRQIERFDSACGDCFCLRKHLSAVGRKASADQLHVLRAEAQCADDTSLAAGVKQAQKILASGVPLELGELAIKGGRLMEITGLRGRAVGDMLSTLLAHVLANPSANEIGELERLAKDLADGT